MAKNRSSSASAARSKSTQQKSKGSAASSSKKQSVLNTKRRHASASPAPQKKTLNNKKALKSTNSKSSKKNNRSVSPVRTPLKGRASKTPVPDKKRKGNAGKPTTVVVESDSEDHTPKNKKTSKLEEKNATRGGNHTPVKGRGKSVTPVKLPAQKKRVVQVPLPENVDDAIIQILGNEKSGRLSAARILALVFEAYTGVNEVVVNTAIANLFRTGLFSESKGIFSVDTEVLDQLKPPAPVVVVPEPVEEEVPAVVADAIVEEVATDAVEANPEAVDAAAAATTGSVAGSAKRSAVQSVAKEDSVGSSKKSVARESTKKSASKASAKKPSEDFVDNVIATEDTPAAALPSISEEAN